MKAKKQTHEEFLQFLREKKARDGKLSAIGEWMLSGKSTGWYIKPENMRYVMR